MPSNVHPYNLNRLILFLRCHPFNSPAAHSVSFKIGYLSSSTFFCNNLIHAYALNSSITVARKLFDEIPHRNSTTWSTIISGYVKSGDVIEAVELFRKMRCLKEFDFFPVKVVHASIVKGCSRDSDMRTGSQLHCSSVKLGLDSDSFVAATLIDLYWKCDDIEGCKKVFNFSPRRDAASWTTMISALASQLHIGVLVKVSVFLLFRQMISAGVWPVGPTFCSLIKIFDHPSQLNHAKQVHACMVKLSVNATNHLLSALVTMYGKCGGVDELVRLSARAHNKDLILLTSLLMGSIKNGFHVAGIQMFREMVNLSEPLDGSAVAAAMEAFAAQKQLLLGKEAHGFSLRSNLMSNSSVVNALMNLYAKCGQIQKSTVVFHSIDQKNIDPVNYTTMLTCYAQNGQSEQATSLFRMMIQKGVGLHHVGASATISACSAICATLTGVQVHSFTIKTGLFTHISVKNSLITMYGKCGDPVAAEQLFDLMADKDRITWNSMIGCCSHHGFGQKAIILFYQMQREGFQPDDFSFLGVLTSCSHAGLVDEGREFFKMMGSVYRLEPKVEHLACMIDLLGRARRFKEAVDLINATETHLKEESLLIWESLLGSCSIHGEREIGRFALEKILELEERSVCGLVALSKVSAANMEWEKKAVALTFMKGQGLMKEAAKSWVEVNGAVQVFSPDDKSHPEIFSIYMKLDELRLKMEKMGYVAETRLVGHDTSEEEREISLLRHCGKLALAFVLVVTGQSQRPVKILQNLRCCVDCHVAMKLISKIEERKIILRDSKRFHSFENGICSCGDYW